MNFLKTSLTLLALGLAALSAHAGPAGPTPCTTSSWKITGAIKSADYAGTVTALPGAISATSCIGVYGGNDESGGTLSPNPNLGWKNDGLLNGQGGLISPTQFLSGTQQLMDLKTTGQFIDPGWVMLAYRNDGNQSYGSVDPVGSSPAILLSQVLTYTHTEINEGSGTWKLAVDMDIVAQLEAAGLFDRSFFDHLAFTVKSSTAWAVYDFDFDLINAAHPGAFDLQTPYVIEGTWSTGCDFTCNPQGIGKAISHMSVWARDPLAAEDEQQEVPEPAGLALVGLSLLALAGSRKLARRAR